MLRKIYLEGDMGDKFGRVAQVKAETVREVIQYLDANYTGVKEYLLDKNSKNIAFKIKIGDQYVDDDRELVLPLDKGDIIITPVPAGSKGAFKLIVGIILIVVSLINPALAPFLMPIGLGLVSAGLAELMAPDPATDATDDAKEGYLFQGAEQSLPEGSAVPLLYGELRVPGQAISFNLRNSTDSLMNASNAGGAFATSGDGKGNLIRYPAGRT
jgi:predicted phage tail protein